MCWQCDNPWATKKDVLNHLRAIIRRRGWAVQYVESDTQPFAYTIGMHDKGVPELLVTGLDPHTSVRMLDCIARDVVDNGTVLWPSMHIALGDDFVLEVVEVEHPDVHLPFAVGIYGPIRALQLVWTDDARQWPWDRDWALGHRPQAVLGSRSPLSI